MCRIKVKGSNFAWIYASGLNACFLIELIRYFTCHYPLYNTALFMCASFATHGIFADLISILTANKCPLFGIPTWYYWLVWIFSINDRIKCLSKFNVSLFKFSMCALMTYPCVF